MGAGKPDLSVRWSKRERALVYDGSSPTAGMLSGVFERITMGGMNERMCGPECKRNGIAARIRDGQPLDPTDSRTLAQELAVLDPQEGTVTCVICNRSGQSPRLTHMCAACTKAYERQSHDDGSVIEAMAWAARRARWYAQRKVSR